MYAILNGGEITTSRSDDITVDGLTTFSGGTLGDGALPTLVLDVSIHALHKGDVLTIIDNDNTDAVVGTFDGLTEGDQILIGSEAWFTISYLGGSGNDMTLTSLVPEPASMTLLVVAGLALLRSRKLQRN